MKRSLLLWTGLLAFALAPVFAQAPAPAPAPTAAAGTTGKIHGHVTNPTGEPQGAGSVSLSTDGGNTLKYTFPVNANGDYAGEAPAGTYMVIYRAPDTPAGKMVDYLKAVKVVPGQDVLADIDMSRQEYIDKMPPEQKKQLEELKKANSEAIKANKVINQLNADLRVVNEDINQAGTARAQAVQQLGANASPADIATKTTQIQTAKYSEIETLMTKDTALKPDEPILWTQLAYAQSSLKKYDQAETTYKKALDIENAAKKPNPEILGKIHSGLGEVYARTGKVQQANAEFDAAAKADPTRAALYLRNEAVIFFQEKNGPAQVAAANEAIQTTPNDAILYYIKGQGLVQNATIDPKTQRIVLPPDCAAAYQKYLELSPDGPYAGEVKGILSQAGEKISSSYKAGKKKR